MEGNALETFHQRRAQLRVPLAAPVPFMTIEPIDRRLLEIARDERAGNAGITPEAFARHNVAVARVRIDGNVDYLSAGNLPDRRGGVHSEEYLLSQVDTLQKQGRGVTMEQLYSERHPCRQICLPLIKGHWPGAAVFYSVDIPFDPAARTKAKALMRAYGL